MNPDDDDAVINQLKHPRISLEVLPKVGGDFLRALENRKLIHDGRPHIDLQIFSEDELVRKEYKELHCEMPGTPRSTFLMVFSPDGTKVASTHGNHNIYITDLKSGRNIKTLMGHPRTPWCIAFHPTCNELVASGCLGGQVRIWDLSGGSEVWTASSQTVIASIAFHPNDRILVIATYNELHFWDWSKPQPFKRATTSNTKEKVRYVAFDKLGHKLITGIANTPQSRWERSRATTSQNRWDRAQTSVPVPVRSLSPSPYRRRITPRLVSNYTSYTSQPSTSTATSDRVPLSTVPERERRITACYRNLVHEYELLVHRYLQIYRPPTTIDRGTDPMETSDNPIAGSSSSSVHPSTSNDCATAGPSTSGTQQQTSTAQNASCRVCIITPMSVTQHDNPNTSSTQTATEAPSRRRLIVRTTLGVQTNTETQSEPSTSRPKTGEKCTFKMRIKCSTLRRSTSKPTPNNNKQDNNNSKDSQKQDLSQNTSELTENSNIGGTGLETPGEPEGSSMSSNLPQDGNKELRVHLKRLYPGFIKKAPKHSRKPISVLETSSDNSSSEEDNVAKKRSFYSIPQSSYSTSSTTNSTNVQTEWNDTASTSTCTNANIRTCNRTSMCHMSNRSPLERIISLKDFVNNGNQQESEICDRCGGNVGSESDPRPPPATPMETPRNGAASTSTSCPPPSIDYLDNPDFPSLPNVPINYSRTLDSTQPCARTLMNTDTSTTNSTVYTPSSGPRRRFFSHVLSAFLPTRVVPQARARSTTATPPRNPLDSITRGSNRLSFNFAPDEVINYSERVNSEEDLTEQPPSLNEFHPFDPPPEFPSINPENIGIGNMYSNIVQDLESSLNNVRNIRSSNRPGETSDMLSSFSERLESIMHQSDSILRNLRYTMDMLPPNSEQTDTRRVQRASPALQLPSPRNTEPDHPRFLFNDPHFYVRDQNHSNLSERNRNLRSELIEWFNSGTQHEELDSNRSAIASDHTYPRNPESPRTLPQTSDNLTPLMTSLHLTISHIQRQARLLRRQVESIERIDRAMLEVAQLQMIRQMFGELRRHLTCLNSGDNRSTGVSSVRQMMAGTRISDSSPCDSPTEDETTQRRSNSEQRNSETFGIPDSSTSSSSGDVLPNSTNPQVPRQRVTARKSFPPSRLLHFQRQNRRFSVVNFMPRRYVARDRLTRRRVYFRTFSVRPNTMRATSDMSRSEDQAYPSLSHINYEGLTVVTRRLEQLLTEHIRRIGRPAETSPREPNMPGNDVREDTIVERLYACRARLNRLSGQTLNNPNQSHVEISSVTPDGTSRFDARDTLSRILEGLALFFLDSTNRIPQSLRSQIRNVIDLTSLLSDILLLHIVDSIPPPTGMNLDPERESLSTRIDQMCTRMLHSRFGQSHNLGRSLRLMRLTARYASRALGQTFNMRRNAMFSNGNSSRRELLGQINSTLHSIHRNRGISYTPMEIPNNDPFAPEMPVREWYRRINALVSRYSTAATESNQSSGSSGSGWNSRLTDNNNSSFSEDVHNSDDNDEYEPDWFNNNVQSERRQPQPPLLYRSSNVNLLHSEEAPPSSSQNRSWNVPTVQINDIPISESNSTWHSRIAQHRYRLSELRSTAGNLFRPRFLHPLYAGVNPFDADLDDPQREQMYDGDMILTVTPNHRIQAWDISTGNIPDISNSMKNLVVGECKIHNDASVDISADGTILVTLLPSGGYLNVTNRLGVYSLRWETLGQCLYQTSFEQNAVSVSLSPLSRHLVVGLASRRVSIVPNDKWTMARIFLLNQNDMPYGSRLPVLRELEQNRDTNYMSLNCIRWLPVSGQGLIYATNTGQLKILT